ncbi:DNA replication and repair protein RecF [Agromyces flavus]|uniref:DNA replication and repair protein RecF n=1 Tax=Agromyces flavus TaxID=589382 RepID=A0A1H1YV40_9MICO|nr:DNA replication/repair protein RecF [Agromyces flavus]MCP2366824.1 DNA replication and repair protein RecF [Agromyces flavus]GGI45446.1 DNA replication and repair protein RecF [Agromyces flavus]SDT25405.1 DNA replication and repair protein RecF [Agromyces flavus]
MHVARLSLTDFRNYRRADLAFGPGATVIVGRNGQGKTNLVEAIGYLATLGSHRVSSDQALIRAGADAAIVRAVLAHGGREVLLELQLNRQGANRAQVNRGAAKPRDLPRYAHSVLFAPEDLAIVRGEPSVRRRMLDELLVQRTPRLAGVMSDYERVLKQRNSLLKSARARGLAAAQLPTLDIWDERLVALGAELIDRRLELIDELREPVAAAYRSIVDADHAPELRPVLSVDGADPDDEATDGAAAGPTATTDPTTAASGYRGAADSTTTAERFAATLAALRRKELERGITLAGPHRDDVQLLLNGLPAKGYASHGESWSFALSLRLAAAELLRRDSTTGDPVLVLDDVFAELDRLRRERLAAAIGGYEQVLITAAVLEDVPEPLASRVVRIDAGQIVDPGAATEDAAVESTGAGPADERQREASGV